MAAAVVQAVFADVAASPVSATLTTTAGNAVVVYVFGSAAFTQTAGDTLTADRSRNASGDLKTLYSNLNVAGGSTTYTFTNASGAMSMIVVEVSGLLTAAAFDASADTDFSIATTHSSGTTGTTAQADEFVLAGFHFDGSGSTGFTSLSNGFTLAISPASLTMGAGINQRCAVAYLITSSTGTFETTLTSDNAAGDAMIGTYKAAAAGAAVTYPMLERSARGIERGILIGEVR